MMYNHHANYEHYRKGDIWLEFEDDALLFELQNNLTIDEIAYKHRRTKNAINLRINQIALKMYKNYSTIDEIINTTKLYKKKIDLILKHKKVQMNIKNDSWNKPIKPDKKIMFEEEKELTRFGFKMSGIFFKLRYIHRMPKPHITPNIKILVVNSYLSHKHTQK